MTAIAKETEPPSAANGAEPVPLEKGNQPRAPGAWVAPASHLQLRQEEMRGARAGGHSCSSRVLAGAS